MTHVKYPTLQSGTPCKVRNRLAVIQQVHTWESGQDTLSLVRVKYLDRTLPETETLLWNVEPQAALRPNHMLPPEQPTWVTLDYLKAVVQAQKITANRNFLRKLATDDSPENGLTAPARCAFKPEDYQLVPLLKAVSMPVVTMMIADEIGMGKTLEAGLIARELMDRRRARKILIVCPKQLQEHWKREMKEKFELDFTIVDHDQTLRIRRDMGLDKNPWRHVGLAITAAQYLSQPITMEHFLAAVSQDGQSRTKPWDLLILDEAHNLAPQPDGDESDTTLMLRQLAGLCQHKVFITATPLAGQLRAFTGLLEILDPTRFRQANHMTEAERKRIPQVMVARRKTDVRTRAMAPRQQSVPLNLDRLLATGNHLPERTEQAFQQLLRQLRDTTPEQTRDFVIETLSRWYSSSILTLQAFWKTLVTAFNAQEQVDEQNLMHLKNSLEQEQTNDLVAQQWNLDAATQIGAWLARKKRNLDQPVRALDRILSQIKPQDDPKIQAAQQLIRQKLTQQNNWKDSERLVIFTAFKQTQDSIAPWLIPQELPQQPQRIGVIFEGMPAQQRELTQMQFNDPRHPVRILIVTDAATARLNLQKQARFILHLDCPWNPLQIEQRNGRLDRHGQTRQVTPFYLDANALTQLKILADMMRCTQQHRHDLGAVANLIRQTTRKHLILNQKPDQTDWNRLEKEGTDHAFQTDRTAEPKLLLRNIMPPENQPQELLNLIRQALGQPLSDADVEQTFKLPPNLKPEWSEIARESLGQTNPEQQIMLAFNLKPFLDEHGVFQQRHNLHLIHLAHPLLRKAADTILGKQFRQPKPTIPWNVQFGSLNPDCQAVITLYIHETAVSKAQETIHDFLQEMTFKIHNGLLFQIKENKAETTATEDKVTQQELNRAEQLFLNIREALEKKLQKHRRKLRNEIRKRMDNAARIISEQEHLRLQSREGELSPLMHRRTVNRKLREIRTLENQQSQTSQFLFPELAEQQRNDLDKTIKAMTQDLRKDQRHYDDLRAELENTRRTIIENIIPRRFSLDGEPQMTAIAMKIMLPKPRQDTP